MMHFRALPIDVSFNRKSRRQIAFVFFCSVILQILPLFANAQSTSFLGENSYSVSTKNNGARADGLDGQAGNTRARVSRLLNWLDIENNILQIDRVIRQNSQHFASDLSGPEVKLLRQRLRRHNDSQEILQAVHSKIGIALAAKLYRIEHLLADPLPVRVRNFDVAMSMTGAKEKFRVYRENLQIKQPSTARLNLIKRLDSALKTTALVALIQTEINVTAQILVAEINRSTEPFLPSAVINFQRQQRTAYIGGLSSDLHLFSYRFLKDAELIQYVELIEEPDIQLLLEAAYQSIRQNLIQNREKVLAAG